MSGAPKQSAEAVLSELADAGHVIGAMIEISDRCNEVCVHCYQIQGQKGEMDTAQVKAVMDDLAQAGVPGR